MSYTIDVLPQAPDVVVDVAINSVTLQVVTPPDVTLTVNANLAYSSLTRFIREGHVRLNYETHGDKPGQRVADDWAKGVEKRSAHWHLSHRHAFTSEKMQESSEKLKMFFAERYGEHFAQAIGASPAYEALILKAEHLRRQGVDAEGLIAQTIDQRELDTADDIAKVVLWRLEMRGRTEDYDPTQDFRIDESKLDPELLARLKLGDLNRTPEQRPQHQPGIVPPSRGLA